MKYNSIYFLAIPILFLTNPVGLEVAAIPNTGFLTSQASSQSPIIELSDLPSGFELSPLLLTNLVSPAIDQVKNNLAKKTNGVAGKNIIFADVAEEDMVACVKINLPKKSSQDKFDAALKGSKGREFFQSQFKQAIQLFGNVGTLHRPEQIASLGNIGEFAQGYRLEGQVKNNIFFNRVYVDTIAFRRQQTAVLVIFGSVSKRSQRVNVQELALKIDQRLQNNTP